MRIDPDNENYDFVTMIFSGDNDIPLTVDGYLILFNKLNFLTDAIKIVDPEVYNHINISELYIFDIAQTLYLISHPDIAIDDSTTIVDTLNIILDLVKATLIKIPSQYKSILFECADYFTFSKEISPFFDSNIKRERVVDVILWSMGAIIIKSKFINN